MVRHSRPRLRLCVVATSSALLVAGFCFAAVATRQYETSTVVYAAETQAPPATLPIPHDYREWVYLTSGLDMTYTVPSAATTPVAVAPSAAKSATGTPAASAAFAPPPNHDGQFDNVFVNPDAYRTFVQSGTWPDNTIFVLENREAKRAVSINKGGRTQGEQITGIELHVKKGGQWAFYVRKPDATEHLVSRPASCYTCHEAHGTVDTTFVQFYPTLLPVAQTRGVYDAAKAADSASGAH